MFNLPQGLYHGVIEMASGIFGDLAPIVILVCGIMLGFWIFEIVIGLISKAVSRRIEMEKSGESILASAYKTLKLKSTQIAKIGKKDKATQQAIILRARFKDLMAEK